MGCFDYECACCGKSCEHVGGQHQPSKVYIEVPLNDGTTVYLVGNYEEYGYVVVNLQTPKGVHYKFYLKEFEEFFDGWFDDESELELRKTFLANKAWTKSELTTVIDEYGYGTRGCMVERGCFHNTDKKEVSPFTMDMLGKCIRADSLCLDRQKKRIESLKRQVQALQTELGRTNRP
jgi:hypothetical protein